MTDKKHFNHIGFPSIKGTYMAAKSFCESPVESLNSLIAYSIITFLFLTELSSSIVIEDGKKAVLIG